MSDRFPGGRRDINCFDQLVSAPNCSRTCLSGRYHQSISFRVGAVGEISTQTEGDVMLIVRRGRQRRQPRLAFLRDWGHFPNLIPQPDPVGVDQHEFSATQSATTFFLCFGESHQMADNFG
jgi:hypothetical protein